MAPVDREASVAPVDREASVFSVDRGISMVSVDRETSVTPVDREASVAPMDGVASVASVRCCGWLHQAEGAGGRLLRWSSSPVVVFFNRRLGKPGVVSFGGCLLR